jgi:hypothetical protein
MVFIVQFVVSVVVLVALVVVVVVRGGVGCYWQLGTRARMVGAPRLQEVLVEVWWGRGGS